MTTRRNARANGFTIIELLTVISIMVMIVGLVVPAIGYARRLAKELTVKSQIKTISEGLEGFYSDFQYYPPSAKTARPDGKFINGAQSMTEALMGIDLHGYDRMSNFASNPEANNRVYNSNDTTADGKASLNRRATLYVTPEPKMAAVDPAYLYSPAGDGTSLPDTVMYMGGTSARSMGPVLCDGFGIKDVTVNNQRLLAGTPFLYFLASSDSKVYDVTKKSGNIYNWQDNEDIMKLPPVSEQQPHHEFWTGNETDGMRNFYEAIRNPAITSSPRPFNMDKFIIISAGADGIYGTSDDIMNFTK